MKLLAWCFDRQRLDEALVNYRARLVKTGLADVQAQLICDRIRQFLESDEARGKKMIVETEINFQGG